MTKANLKNLIQKLRLNGIDDESVLNAFAKIPRDQFVLTEDVDLAYEDTALPIQCNQTISQPYIIAEMTQTLIHNTQTHKVLELGTGSGYQTAILSLLYDEVYTIERIETLYKIAKSRFEALGLSNIHPQYGDGYKGWAQHAPFDGILITAAPKKVPEELLQQLNPNGGRMVIPVGADSIQELKSIERHGDTFTERFIEHVRFVPLLPGTKS